MLDLRATVTVIIGTVIHVALGCSGGKKELPPGFAFRSGGAKMGDETVGSKSESMSEKEEKKDTRSAIDNLEPRRAQLGEEKAIARGAVKKFSEYPTFDDVPSDWEDKDGSMNGDKKEEDKK